MDSSKASSDQLTEYIQAIEKQQRSQIRSKIIYVGIIAGISIIGALAVLFLDFGSLTASESEYIYLDPGVYSMAEIDSFIQTTNKKVILSSYPGNIRDTIASSTDVVPTGNQEVIIYNSPIGKTSSFSGIKKASLNTLPQIPSFGLEIEGFKTIDNELNFSLIGYQNIFSYHIDFGNGVKKMMGKNLTYAFPKEGDYTIQVRATSPAYAPRTFSLPISINKDQSFETNQAILFEQPYTTVNLNSESIEHTTQGNPPEVETEGNNTQSSQNSKKSINYIPPSFPGGQSALASHIQNNLAYPPEAIQNKVKGEVVIRFLVEEDGAISNIGVHKGLGYGCDEEVLKIVQNMPKWIPGSLNGKNLAMTFSLPIRFELN